MNKVTYSENGFTLFYRSDLHRSVFRFSGLTVYFSEVSFIPSIGQEPDFYSLRNIYGAETAKISAENVPEKLQSRLDRITQDGGSSE